MADFFDHGDRNSEDAAWERLQRDSLAALNDDDLPRARRQLGEALVLAREKFSSGDPRLAASLAANAWLQRTRAPHRAAGLFAEALAHWAQADTWLAHQPSPGRLARSSSFHLRLESKHPGAYRERRAADMTEILARGQALTEGLRDQCPVQNSIDHSPETATFGTSRKIETSFELLRKLHLRGPDVTQGG